MLRRCGAAGLPRLALITPPRAKACAGTYHRPGGGGANSLDLFERSASERKRVTDLARSIIGDHITTPASFRKVTRTFSICAGFRTNGWREYAREHTGQLIHSNGA